MVSSPRPPLLRVSKKTPLEPTPLAAGLGTELVLEGDPRLAPSVDILVVFEGPRCKRGVAEFAENRKAVSENRSDFLQMQNLSRSQLSFATQLK